MKRARILFVFGCVLRLVVSGCLPAAVWAEEPASVLSEYSLRRWGVEDGLVESAVLSVKQEADGYLWCRTPHHLFRFDGIRFLDLGTPAPASLSRPPPATPPFPVGEDGVPLAPTALLLDAEGGRWVGTARGVFRWHQGRWTGLTARDGMFPEEVHCLAQDREGNIWMGAGGGLIRLRQKRVKIFRARAGGESEPITALLAEGEKNLLVGVAGSALFAGPPDRLRPFPAGKLSERVTVSTLLRGKDGTLWIGTQGDSLWRQRPGGPVEKVRLAARGGPSPRGITALLEDRAGRLWVGAWEGLMRLHPEGTLATVQDLPSDTVQHLCEGRNGRIWVAYQRRGIACLDRDGRFQLQRIREDAPDLCPFVLSEDAEGTLWIGASEGLARWKSDQRNLFTVANGLVDPVILQIIDDGEGRLWLGTRRGLMWVSKSEFTEVADGRKSVLAVRHLGEEAGFTDEECTGRFGARAARSADGRLWFPTMDGLAMIDPAQLNTAIPPPRVYVEEVLGNGLPVENRDGLFRAPLGARDVEFRFTAPVFSAPERVFFKYRLKGYDPHWSNATVSRSLRYSHLPPGRYQFEVMARDRDSGWSEPAPPAILILPSYLWETAWFRVLAAVGAIGVAAVGIQVYYRRQSLREIERIEQRHAVERERARIARDIHDDVGAGLTEIAMLSELARDARQPPEDRNKLLDGIFRRGRELTRSLNEIVWAINPANDTLENFLSYVGEFAQEFLGAAGISCRLDLPLAPPALPLSANIRHHLLLGVKEALHNVAKHAGAGEVRLAARIENGMLTMTIQDNGRGFDPETVRGTQREQDGLANIASRLAEIGGRLHRESRSGQGTLLILSVKLPFDASRARESH